MIAFLEKKNLVEYVVYVNCNPNEWLPYTVASVGVYIICVHIHSEDDITNASFICGHRFWKSYEQCWLSSDMDM